MLVSVHCFVPDALGSFDANDDDIGTGIAGAPACGDVMKLQVRCHA